MCYFFSKQSAAIACSTLNRHICFAISVLCVNLSDEVSVCDSGQYVASLFATSMDIFFVLKPLFCTLFNRCLESGHHHIILPTDERAKFKLHAETFDCPFPVKLGEKMFAAEGFLGLFRWRKWRERK